MLVLAHRGARRVEPENTLAAFAAARRLGADGVELDVHSTAEGALVVHHDPEIAGCGIIREAQLPDIRQAVPTVPTLSESLDLLDGLVVNIEIKNAPGLPGYDEDCTTSDRVVETLNTRIGAKVEDRVLVSSFHLPTLSRIKELDGAIPTGLLTVGIEADEAIELAAGHGHSAWNPHISTLVSQASGIVVEAHARGLEVFVWTVNEPADVRMVEAAGVDALITDVPDVAVQVREG